MEVEIKKTDTKLFVDSTGLYANIYVDLVVKQKQPVEFITMDFVMPSSSGSKDL